MAQGMAGAGLATFEVALCMRLIGTHDLGVASTPKVRTKCLLCYAHRAIDSFSIGVAGYQGRPNVFLLYLLPEERRAGHLLSPRPGHLCS
jgi:hypothetical protein